MKRPWKLTWWSGEYGDYRGSSFKTRNAAIRRGQVLRDDGAIHIRVWQNDDRGYVVPGTTEYLR